MEEEVFYKIFAGLKKINKDIYKFRLLKHQIMTFCLLTFINMWVLQL